MTARTISKLEPKLQRLLLLLSSDQPGEVVAAAAAIKRTLKSAGCDFHDLVAGLSSLPRTHEPRQGHDEDFWRAMRDFCLARRSLLRGRELAFLTNLGDWRGDLTKKQNDWLSGILERLKYTSADPWDGGF